jgi:hypothetical protein
MHCVSKMQAFRCNQAVYVVATVFWKVKNNFILIINVSTEPGVPLC